ncbi:hypothetical protein TSUD_189920 [Trifolium subterraneum]|uniref:Uncharacterized protein n=1 Tax=Trifolium subterraneum TaxID=3900 RepID=A0A2Z6NXF1_TRISU|nr:hypothetical protein TSUD_189920 [Trifolium subterraneum]
MDVARLLVRTLGICIVDTVARTVVNGERFDVRLIEDSYGPLRVVVPRRKTKANVEEEVDKYDNDSDEAPSLRRHAEIGEEVLNVHSLATVENDSEAYLQVEIRKDTENLDEDREKELALIAFKSNSNLEAGESTNNATRNNFQEVSSNAADFLELSNIPQNSDIGPRNVGLSTNDRTAGGAKIIVDVVKQNVGPINPCGPVKSKDDNVPKPRVKSMRNILGEGQKIPPSEKHPHKRILTKPTTEIWNCKGGGPIATTKKDAL